MVSIEFLKKTPPNMTGDILEFRPFKLFSFVRFWGFFALRIKQPMIYFD